MKTKYVFNFKEMIGILSSHYETQSFVLWQARPSTIIDKILQEITDQITLVGLFPRIFDNGSLADGVKELLDFLFNEFESYIVFTSNDNDPGNLLELSSYHLYSIMNKANVTASRYLSLLNYYTDKEGELLEQLHSRTTGTSRFNDTPQDSGEFEDLDHNTNVTRSEGDVYTDPTTIMARLNEIQEHYRNLIMDWSKEFRGFFMSPSNYELVED